MKSELKQMVQDFKLVEVMRKNNRILNVLSDYSGDAKVLVIRFNNLNAQKEKTVSEVKLLIAAQSVCLQSLSKLRKAINL